MARRHPSMDLSSILNPQQLNEDVPGTAKNDRSLLSRKPIRNEHIPSWTLINQPIPTSSRLPVIMPQMLMNNLAATPHNTTPTINIPPNRFAVDDTPSPVSYSLLTKRRIEEWLDDTKEVREAKMARLEDEEGELGEQITQPLSFTLPMRPTLATPEKSEVEESIEKLASPRTRKLSIPRPRFSVRKRPSTNSELGPPKIQEVPVSYERTKKIPRPLLGKRPGSNSGSAPEKAKQAMKHVVKTMSSFDQNTSSEMHPDGSSGTLELAGVDGNSGPLSKYEIETARRLQPGEIEAEHDAEDLQIIQAFVRHVYPEGGRRK